MKVSVAAELAATFDGAMVIVPAPSALSVGTRVMRSALHGRAIEIVAVLVPVAPNAAWFPSEPVTVTRLASVPFAEVRVYCWATV